MIIVFFLKHYKSLLFVKMRGKMKHKNSRIALELI